ncbi:MAG: GNAT family N-acetyltransferase [Bacillota bacterium]
MQFKHTDGRDKDFIELCHELDQTLNEIAGGEKNRAGYLPLNRLDDIHDVILAYDGEIPIGCAGFKRYDDECAQVKRVFVKKEYRGGGISKKIMEALEKSVKSKGYRYCILETGAPLIEALGLYKGIGYYIIPNYGEYQCMPDSICMKKEL